MNLDPKIGDRVTVIGLASGARYPGTVSALSSSVVMVRFDEPGSVGLDASFFRDSGQSTCSMKLLRLDLTPPKPIRSVYYRTLGVRSDGQERLGGLHFRSLDEAIAMKKSIAVLKFTEEDREVVDIEVVHVAK